MALMPHLFASLDILPKRVRYFGRYSTRKLYAKTKRQTDRHASGHARPADSANLAIRPDSRPRHRQIHRAELAGRAACGPWLSVSGAAAPGAPGADHRRVGHVGK